MMPADIAARFAKFLESRKALAAAPHRFASMDEIVTVDVPITPSAPWTASDLDELIANHAALRGWVKPPLKLAAGERQIIAQKDGQPAMPQIDRLEDLARLLASEGDDADQRVLCTETTCDLLAITCAPTDETETRGEPMTIDEQLARLDASTRAAIELMERLDAPKTDTPPPRATARVDFGGFDPAVAADVGTLAPSSASASTTPPGAPGRPSAASPTRSRTEPAQSGHGPCSLGDARRSKWLISLVGRRRFELRTR